MSNLHPIFATIIGSWQSSLALSQLPRKPDSHAMISKGFPAGTAVAKHPGMKKKTGWPTKCRVIEYLGDNRALFQCRPANHQFKQQMFPKAPNGRVPSEALILKFAHYWGLNNPDSPGVTMRCPKCQRGQ